jgi:hypothetical protein
MAIELKMEDLRADLNLTLNDSDAFAMLQKIEAKVSLIELW